LIALRRGGADALAGGPPGRAYPSHARADVRVVAGPGFQDLGVARVGLGEHVLDVTDLELVQPQVALVCDEMYPDVAGIAAHGVGVDFEAVQPLRQVRRHSRSLFEGRIGLYAAADGVQIG
jgi:hypothetical protein